MNFNVIVLTTNACKNGYWRNVLHTRLVSHTQAAYYVHNVYFSKFNVHENGDHHAIFFNENSV